MIIHSSHRVESKQAMLVAGIGLLVMLLFIWMPASDHVLGVVNYLPLHMLLETLAIIAAMNIFSIVWSSRKQTLPCNLVIVGVCCCAAGILDFTHMLSYQGMPELVTQSDSEKAINFWLAARLFMSFGLLGTAFVSWQLPLRMRRSWLMLGLALSVTALLHVIFLWFPHWLPRTFIPGSGLTTFKILFDYFLAFALLLAGFRFLLYLRHPRSFNASGFFAAAVLMAQGQVFFTLYADVTDIYNLAGHIYKVLGYFFLYRAVFIEAVQRPYELLDESRKQLDATLGAMPDLLFAMDEQGRYLEVYAANHERMSTPESVQALLGKSVHEVLSPQAAQTALDALAEAKDTGRSKGKIIEVVLPSGKLAWFELSVVPHDLPSEDGCSRFLVVSADISKRILAEQSLLNLSKEVEIVSNHDQLTGLPNRNQLEKFFHKAASSGRSIPLFWLDLDNIKEVNDALGYATGDLLLKQVSYRLRDCLYPGEILARISGDDFVIMLPGVTQGKVALRAQQLLESLASPFVVPGQTLNITASMGIAIYPQDAKLLPDLLQKAEISKYKAKEAGRNNYQFFEAKMQERAVERLAQGNALKRAIENNELSLVYQPQISLRTGRMVGVEPLLRWTTKQWGAVSPLDFIPLAESNGMILPIGEWVLRSALQQKAAWLAQGIEPFSVAVNISAIQFEHPNLVDLIKCCLNETAVPARLLELELTEAVAMKNPELSEQRIEQLHELEVRLSIDDFGTGYSSLSYLKRFKIDKLKIDREFIREMDSNADDQAITTAVIQMAQQLSITTLAEGVETASQLELLKQYGCDLVQGYYYSRPLTPQQLEEFIRANNVL